MRQKLRKFAQRVGDFDDVYFLNAEFKTLLHNVTIQALIS